MRLLKFFALLATLAAAGAAAAQADSGGWGPETPNFNLEVILRPIAAGPAKGFGQVEFRQPNDANTIIYLDAWVRDLAPNHTYYLERAVDTDLVDSACTGAMWLRLGSITTDDRGTGRAALSRGLPPTVTPGTQFDIHFHVIEAVTQAEVLKSGCYQFTVSL
jgi:hypothetical protein